MQVSRRGVLAGAAVGGGLLVAWTLWPRTYTAPLSPGRGERAFNAWLKIGRDGIVTVAVPQLEMGQGITTLLPQIAAVELGADWRQVAVEPAPVSGAYPNLPLAARWAPLWMPVFPGLADDPDDLLVRRFAADEAFMATADGTSLAAYEAPCREAAAAARAMLAMAAADRWDVSWEECSAHDGFVFHGNRHLTFGELADEAAGYTPPDPPPLRDAPAFELPDAAENADSDPSAEETPPLAFPRLDLPAKVDGSLLFAGDIRLPGMLYAAIRHGPAGDATLKRFDPHAAARVWGFRKAVKSERWLAALATTWWAAERALEAMAPIFHVVGPVSSEAIDDTLDHALTKGKAVRIATRGAGDAELGAPEMTFRYDIAAATHATLETATVTARLADGRLELWLATQAPEHARRAAARALGMSAEDVVLYPVAAGGSFDRRLEHDHAIEAALIAREAGAPVQLVWSRWQEALAGRPRTPLACLASGWAAQEDGAATGLRLRMAMPATVREFGERLFENKTGRAAIDAVSGEPDPLAFEGALPPYAIADIAIDHVPATIPLSTGRLRGNAHGYLAFVVESMIDEFAARVAREPVSYRIELLGGDPRLAECLQRAARLAEWGGGAKQSGEGVACWRIDGGGEDEPTARNACIATAHAGEGGVRVTRLSAAVDLGRVVNHDIARQQIEGGLVFGTSLALGSALTWDGGLPDGGRLAALALPRLADCPQIAVELIAGDGPSADPGEIAVAVAPPAIANALHSASGLRLRRLPLLSGGL
jgi:isoquinoline 1-oxidoreductase beta subunit